jgi:hypothetical protein
VVEDAVLVGSHELESADLVVTEWFVSDDERSAWRDYGLGRVGDTAMLKVFLSMENWRAKKVRKFLSRSAVERALNLASTASVHPISLGFLIRYGSIKVEPHLFSPDELVSCLKQELAFWKEFMGRLPWAILSCMKP